MIADSSQAGRIGRAESAPRASIRGACRFDVLHSKSLGVLWLIVFISLMGFGMTAIPFPLVAERMSASDFWKTFGGSGVFSLLQLASTPL